MPRIPDAPALNRQALLLMRTPEKQINEMLLLIAQ